MKLLSGIINKLFVVASKWLRDQAVLALTLKDLLYMFWYMTLSHFENYIATNLVQIAIYT